MTNPYLFVVGCPRSGTTLLQRMLDAHPDLTVVNESRFIASFYEKRRGLTPRGDVTPELVDKLLGYDRFAMLGADRQDLERLLPANGTAASFAAFMSGVYDLYGAARSKRFVGDKTPRYVRSIATLHALWPDARFVHLIRDGRDTCLSLMSWAKGRGPARFPTWEEDAVSTAALWWEWHVTRGREAGADVGNGLYHEIRYEALSEAPEATCAELCSWLNLAYEPTMVSFHLGRTVDGTSLDAKKAWLPATPGLRDFRAQMTGGDIARVEAVAGDLLGELGYERAGVHIDGAARRHAEAVHDRFYEHVGAR